MKYLALGFRLLGQIQSIEAVERSSGLLPLQRSGRLRNQQQIKGLYLPWLVTRQLTVSKALEASLKWDKTSAHIRGYIQS